MSPRPRLLVSLGISLSPVRATPSGGKRPVCSAGSKWPAACPLIPPYRRPLGLAPALVIATRGPALAVAGEANSFIGGVIGRHQSPLLLPLALAAAGAIALECTTAFGASRVTGNAGRGAIADRGRQARAHLLRVRSAAFMTAKGHLTRPAQPVSIPCSALSAKSSAPGCRRAFPGSYGGYPR